MSTRIAILLVLLTVTVGCATPGRGLCSCHPLMHPAFDLIDEPLSTTAPGWLGIDEVMAYLFASAEERRVATVRLAHAGYGAGETDYLFAGHDRWAVNGEVFDSLIAARAYVEETGITRLLFVSKGEAFPDAVPAAVRIAGIDIWVLDSQK
jgi:hypothetical protein